ncbi:MAG: tetratricopeptide repeat protein [Gammaproteobacteria bacterium]|jgi:pentatricopeptide repeat protein
MSDYVTEEQQIEALKEWWKEYGLSIIVGLVLAIIVIFGWRFYQRYKTNIAERASIVYARMTVDVLNSQWQDAITQAKLLRKNFARTPYAKIAALTLAKHAVSQNNFDDAVAQLNWAVKHASSDVLLQLARLRLARVYITQNKIKEALALLQRMKNSSLAGLAAEVQGDAYVKLGNIDKAREMYQLALKEISEPDQSRPVLQMKLDNL